MSKEILSDIDLQLYIAKALPWYKRVYIFILSILNGEVKKQLQKLHNENAKFSAHEQKFLKNKIFGATLNKERVPFWNSAFMKPAISFALICMIALPVFFTMQNQPQFTPKGTGLGVNIYKKDADYSLLVHDTIILSTNDTIQILPIGKSEQYFTLFALSNNSTLQLVYPESSDSMQPISISQLPPSLVFDGDKTDLICVSSNTSRTIQAITQMVHAHYSTLSENRPLSHIVDGVYIQRFLITSGESHE